jgi:TolA-binding protein
MGKEITKGQVIGWAIPVVVAIAGAMLTGYISVREHELRINALEEINRQRNVINDDASRRLQKIETDIAVIKTILEEQEKQRQHQEVQERHAQVKKSQRIATLREAAQQTGTRASSFREAFEVADRSLAAHTQVN